MNNNNDGKQYILKALVQLPDGSFKRCPIADYKEVGNVGEPPQFIPDVKKFPTKKAAWEWQQYILSDRADIYEDGS